MVGTSPVYRQNTLLTCAGILVSTIRLFVVPIKWPPVVTIPQWVVPWLLGNATISPRIGMDTEWKHPHAWMTSDRLFPHSDDEAGEYPQNHGFWRGAVSPASVMTSYTNMAHLSFFLAPWSSLSWDHRRLPTWRLAMLKIRRLLETLSVTIRPPASLGGRTLIA